MEEHMMRNLTHDPKLCYTTTVYVTFQAYDTGAENCTHPYILCDADTCLDPDNVCDGEPDCQDGMDERDIYCNDL